MKSSNFNPNLLHIPCREVKVWTWVLILTLIFNTSFPAFAGSVLFANSDKVLLCTAGGYKSVFVLKYDVTEKSNSHCVICLNTDDADTVISAIGFESEPILYSAGDRFFRDTPSVTSRFLLPILRAPPKFS